MNPLSQLLKLPDDAKVGDAKKQVAEEVMKSMNSQPGREALLSALECGPYDKKFGKKRGKSLTLLDETLPLEAHHAMILQEANRELNTTFHELLEDELEARPLYALQGERPVAFSLPPPDALPSDWRLDILRSFKTSEAALKKQAKELLLAKGLLSREQLSPAQLALLGTPIDSSLEETDQEDEEGEEE